MFARTWCVFAKFVRICKNRSIPNANHSRFQTSPFKTHENPFWILQIPVVWAVVVNGGG